jgi:hypothetical protein
MSIGQEHDAAHVVGEDIRRASRNFTYVGTDCLSDDRSGQQI